MEMQSFMRLLTFLREAPFTMLSLYITAKVAGKPVSISEASIRIFLDIQLKSVPVPLDHFPVNALTSKVFSFMVKKVHVEPQSDLSPRPSPTTHIPDSIPESSGRNHGGQSSSDKSLSGNEGDMTLQSVYDLCISLCTQVTDQAKEIKHFKAQIKKLKKKAKPVIAHHKAWGRKPAKAEPSVHKDPLFDELVDDTLDYMDTENAQDMGRTRFVVRKEKEREEKEVSTDDALGTDKEKVSTDKEKDSTDKEKDSTDRPDEVFLNMSQAKAVSREKEKGVELKDVENIKRPRLTSTRSLLTLKSLPKIDPKDKGSDTESEDINETKKKFKMLAHDEEIARKMQEDWETEEERKRLAKEEATNAALIKTLMTSKQEWKLIDF
ncbi:hypothetical protein Tco_1043273 [Tanacetum coccineum]|uniref:Uncharacterized protein n=1 Tax=Tanacetum coccineum TaxID=301880 RepID=A0ABQ5GLY8_9ASTR